MIGLHRDQLPQVLLICYFRSLNVMFLTQLDNYTPSPQEQAPKADQDACCLQKVLVLLCTHHSDKLLFPTWRSSRKLGGEENDSLSKVPPRGLRRGNKCFYSPQHQRERDWGWIMGSIKQLTKENSLSFVAVGQPLYAK